MLWLLRLFPQFRELERAIEIMDRCRLDTEAITDQRIQLLTNSEAALREMLQEVTTEKLILQDRLDAADSERNRLWERYDTAIAEERKAYAMQINAVWSKEHGTTPYPDAPHPDRPAARPPSDPVPRRMLPSEAVAAATRSFIEQQIHPRR